MFDALVTGASGFIGRALCASLRARGQRVLALTSENGNVARIETWASLPPARVVFHLAGRSFVPNSWRTTEDFLDANVTGTECALSYCRRHGSRLVLASAYLYGVPERLPIREDDRLAPNNPYALTKYMAEQLCEFASRYRGVTTTALRIFNVFGPGQRAEFLIPSILRQLSVGKEVRLLDLTPRRDYVYLSDVVDIFLKAGERVDGFCAINVGSGRSLSVAEMVDKIQMLAGTDLPVITDLSERFQEIPDVLADISTAKDLLGWTPRVTFESGIQKILIGASI